MKIGIIRCLHAGEVCTGAGCLNAFHKRTDFFKKYDADTALVAYMTCNGCEKEQPLQPEDDPGMQEKLARLVKEGVQVMHVGVCRIQQNGKECERMNQILKQIETQGIIVKRGTHM